MNKRLSLPEIPDSERSPLVDALLGIIESLSETVQRQDGELPAGINGHFGPHLEATIQYLHHHSRIPHLLLREMLLDNLLDRTKGTNVIPPLPELIRQRAAVRAAGY